MDEVIALVEQMYTKGIITFFIALTGVVGAAVALLQARIAIRARHGQTFVNILQYANTIEYTKNLDNVRNLSGESLIEGAEAQILPIVNFFNDLGHLIEGGFIPAATLFKLYYPGVVACREKLMGEGQWLERKRGSLGDSGKWLYLHFESFCLRDNQSKLESNKRIVWERPKPVRKQPAQSQPVSQPLDASEA